MLDVTCFTGGKDIPSARFRVRQYIPVLAIEGVSVHEMSSCFGKYPPKSKWLRPVWGLGALASNMCDLVTSWKSDVTLFQREMISTLSTLEPLARSPRVLDVDDAIFLYRGGRAAKKLAKLCDTVICGNEYLGDWFSQFNDKIEILPTAVDSERYVIPVRIKCDEVCVVIGWIGTSGNLKYLSVWEDAFKQVLDLFPKTRLLVVSDTPPELKSIPADRWEFHQWSTETEVAQIQRMDIGLMPLEDSPWTRGKCSFKMLQYMACGIPVVVSPVGMNLDVLKEGEVGLSAGNGSEWVEALATLISDYSYRCRLGLNGRRVVEAKYSVKILAPRFASILKRAGGRS